MKIFLHPYELRSREKPPREGVLLKVEWTPGHFGFSDLHPWPEFGDEPIDVQIETLARSDTTPLLERSLELSAIDHRFRARARSAFLGLALPRAHLLLQDTSGILETRGFTHAKIKLGLELTQETKVLERLAEETDLTLRLDLNGRLAPKVVERWWNTLDPKLKARIDLVEDPGAMTVTGPWAQDWQAVPSAKIRIVKPARDSEAAAAGFERVIFTHCLDHPLGNASALWAAADYYRKNPKQLEVCGLSAANYQSSAFSEFWRCTGPRMTPPPGSGFGFDELLQKLKWDRLL